MALYLPFQAISHLDRLELFPTFHPIRMPSIGWLLDQGFLIHQGVFPTYQSGNESLKHIKKMTVLSPDCKGTETITDARPLLQWQPLEGAVHYKVFWLAHQPQGKIDRKESGSSGEITGTEYRFATDVIPNHVMNGVSMPLDKKISH